MMLMYCSELKEQSETGKAEQIKRQTSKLTTLNVQLILELIDCVLHSLAMLRETPFWEISPVTQENITQ